MPEIGGGGGGVGGGGGGVHEPPYKLCIRNLEKEYHNSVCMYVLTVQEDRALFNCYYFCEEYSL